MLFGKKERGAKLIMGREIKSTVIIPNYNGMRYMENCLCALEGEPAHLIVVDNGSTDGSREFIRDRFPAVQLDRKSVV